MTETKSVLGKGYQLIEKCFSPSKMAVLFLLSSSILACSSSSTSNASDDGQAPYGEITPDQVIYGPNNQSYLAHEVIVQRALEINQAQFLAAIESLGGKIIDENSPLTVELGYQRIILPTNLDVDQAITILESQKVVLSAQRNYVVRVEKTPNDPSYANLWAMPKMQLPAAWEMTTGSETIVAAVSDTGIDYNHPDLAANMWTNTKEIPGNNIDDDKNGFVDDVGGWNFVSNTNDPWDDHYHGTHVAGTMGAVGNNSAGVAGVNWKIKLMPVKLLSSNGSGSLWAGAQAIIYAAKNGARVVNASWGCQGCYTTYVEDAIKQLMDANGLFVAAAGNSAADVDTTAFYPAGYNLANVVAVAATTSSDTLASFSNYGATKVHVAAPGTSILSTKPNNEYTTLQGTSMASPHVAGVAALLLSTRPTLTYDLVKKQMLASCDPVSALSGKVVCNGRLNAYKLLTSVDSTPPAAPLGVKAASGKQNDITITWTPSTESDLAMYRVKWGTVSGQYTFEQNMSKDLTSLKIEGLTHNMTYYFVVVALDYSANLSAASTQVSALAQDATSPPQVVDLTATAAVGGYINGEVIAASGEFSSYYGAAKAHDGSSQTAWLSPARSIAQEEFVVIDLRRAEKIDAVELAANAMYPEFFPIDLDIDLSLDGQSWQTAGSLRGLNGQAGQNYKVIFNAQTAQLVRLRALKAYIHPSGMSYVSVGEVFIRKLSASPDEVALQFTAPGDDPGQGKAKTYDIRYAKTLITESNFSAATAISSPTPATSGLLEKIVVKGLAAETTYYFALKAINEAGNTSPMSNLAQTTTLVIPPAAITDLQVINGDNNFVTLRWTATGDDGASGQAKSYELRYDTKMLTPSSFSKATLVANVPSPKPAGSIEVYAVSDLSPGVAYYFALRAIDHADIAGPLSNVVVGKSQPGHDHTPPATVNDLHLTLAQPDERLSPTIHSQSSFIPGGWETPKIVDNNLSTIWSSQKNTLTTPEWIIFDLGGLKPLSRYRMFPFSSGTAQADYPQDLEIQISLDALSWTPVIHVENLLAEAGMWNQWADAAHYAKYVRLWVNKRQPVTCSSPTSCATDGYVKVAEFETWAQKSVFGVLLTWPAPGDDGYSGQAAGYELRYAHQTLTEENFSQADLIPTGLPQPGGLLEFVDITPLEGEDVYYFAFKAIDASGNKSAMSNVVTIAAPAVPPAPVTDLTAISSTKTTIALNWTATGDNGLKGTATSYDLRYSTLPITAQNWNQATKATGLPAPQAAGTKEAFTVSNLQVSTVYYFALDVLDDLGNHSGLSNVAQLATLDGIAPSAVTTLTATPTDPTLKPALALTLVDYSSAIASSYKPDKLLDGNTSTFWLTAASATMQPEYARFKLPSTKNLGKLRLTGKSGYLDLFPVDFQIQVKLSSESNWTTVIQETSFSTNGSVEEWSLGSVAADEIRLSISKTKSLGGAFYAALAELAVYEDPTDYSRVALTWQAPGDDNSVGQAAKYDLRQSNAILDESTFNAAQVVAVPFAPQAAGGLERLEVAGLNAETKYCFALKASDEQANVAPVSNSPCVTTPGLPPSTITDLLAKNPTGTSVTLAWTAPGADGKVGQAASYELRYAKQRLTSLNWSSATIVSNVPSPQSFGTAETFTVIGLLGGTTFYFALRAKDSAGNFGAISNNTSATTLDAEPPVAISDLQASTYLSAWGTIIASWTTPSDVAGKVTSYDLRVSTSPITDSNFVQAQKIDVGLPGLPGSKVQATISGLLPELLYYVALKSTDSVGNVSTLSNIAQAFTRYEAPAAITNFKITSGTGNAVGQGTLSFSWTATGDDDRYGTASIYELRYSASPIYDYNFAQAALASNLPTPALAGVTQTYTLANLPIGKTLYVAIKAVDDRGLYSSLVWISGLVPDAVAPSPVTDLVAQTGPCPGCLDLAWTEPSDNSGATLVSIFDLRWSTASITAANFSAATSVTISPSPLGPVGQIRTFTVSGLPNETNLHLALRTKDAAGNWSVVSNDASAWTPAIAPAAVTDLRQTAKSTSTISLAWTAPGDDGSVGTASTYDLRYALVPITTANWSNATQVTTSAPKSAGSLETITISGLSPDKIYYVVIKAKDDRDQWSTFSNQLVARTTDTIAPAAITNLKAVTGSSAGAIRVSWTAVGDDANIGQATKYELRYAKAAITESNFSSATLVATLAPAASGIAESTLVTNLTGETVYYFAIVAIDEDNNMGPLSANASASTLPIAPSAIADLKATAAPGQIALSWTAPGDDGAIGQATSYELRYSATAITDGNFISATLVSGAPTPALAGTVQNFVVKNLAESTKYYLALKTIDDVGAISALSNVAFATTPDITPPSAPGSFVVTAPATEGNVLKAQAIEASSRLGEAWSAANAIDNQNQTAWASAGSSTSKTDWLLIDLGAEATIDQIRLLPDALYTELFPANFSLEVSTNKSTFKTVAVEENFAINAATWLSWGFAAETARYVRLKATDQNASFGLHYSVISEMEIVGARPNNGQARLTWTAPGDDNNQGTATIYQVYRHTSPFDVTNISSATLISSAPTPLAAGALQTMYVTGLAGETTYYWAIRALDEAGNIGPLSTIIGAKTNAVAPAPVTDLTATNIGQEELTLTWKATGDDGLIGTAAGYELRYATFPITTLNFPLATKVENMPMPASSGTVQSTKVSGLKPGTVYRLALIVRDEANTASYLSNIVLATTVAAPDFTVPSTVTDLKADLAAQGDKPLVAKTVTASSQQLPGFGSALLIDGQYSTMWSNLPKQSNQEEFVLIDLGASQNIERLRLWPGSGFESLFPSAFELLISNDQLTWLSVSKQTSYEAKPNTPFVVEFPSSQARFFKLVATELALGSNNFYYAVIGEIEAFAPANLPGTIMVWWTAPGDDAAIGQAAAYQLAYSACPYSPSAATTILTKTPLFAGSVERYLVSGLASGTYCLGLTTSDEAGNTSSLSNIAPIIVP